MGKTHEPLLIYWYVMATYKVIQDIEAEDKLVGPLTLRQFIYAGIAATSGYLGFLTASKGAAFMLAVFIPITGVCGFFAFPWRQDQPTELWALAKIRFYLKPRQRKWDQSGTKEMVTVTAPKVVERQLTNGLRQDEVHSRLGALADTLDSRGWAIKNVNVNMSTPTAVVSSDERTSDRLIQASSMPQEVNTLDINASDDMLDEAANPIAHQFDNMITEAGTAHRQQLIAQMQQPTPAPSMGPHQGQGQRQGQGQQHHKQQQGQQQTPNDYWFMQGQTPTVNEPGQATFGDDVVITPGSQSNGGGAAMPTPDEEAMVHKLKTENEHSTMTAAYGHMKTLKTPEQLAAEAREAVAKAAATKPAKPPVTPTDQAAIINLANNDDLDVATIARQAKEQVSSDNDGEVVISLH